MKYYLLMYADEKGGAACPKDEMDAWIAEIKAWSENLKKAGVLVRSEGLHPTSAASTVRVADTLTTAGLTCSTRPVKSGNCAWALETKRPNANATDATACR